MKIILMVLVVVGLVGFVIVGGEMFWKREFKKEITKYEKILLFIFLAILIIGLVLTKIDEKNEEYGTNEIKQEENYVVKSDLDEAYDIVYEVLDEAFEGKGFEIDKNKSVNTLTVRFHINESAILNTDRTTWNDTVDSCKRLCEDMKKHLEDKGYHDVHISMAIGDFDADSYYYMVMDGNVIFDLINEERTEDISGGNSL